MIDIHSHIIFGVDDGPKNQEETLLLLQESYRQGVRGIIATSHRRKGMFETPEEIILANFKQTQELAKQVADDLYIFYGAEIYVTDGTVQELAKKRFPMLSNSKSVLVEFSPQIPYKKMSTYLGEIIRLGLTPVIAHIERYDALENAEEKVEELIDMGCFMQVNSSSILKIKRFRDSHRVYKQRAQYFLERELVHFVASDMHNLDTRAPYMDQAYQQLKQNYGETYAKELCISNPVLLLKNQL